MTKRMSVKITLAHTKRPDVFDSEGRRHQDGDMVQLLPEDLEALNRLGLCQPVTVHELEQMKALGKERLEVRNRTAAKARAEQLSSIYDSMPPEWRARAREEGDAVIEEYLQSLPAVSLDTYEQHKGEPFIERRAADMAIEGADAPAPINGELGPVPLPVKRKRGRPRKVIEGGGAA